MTATSTAINKPIKRLRVSQQPHTLTDEQIRHIADQVYLRLLAELREEHERLPFGCKSE